MSSGNPEEWWAWLSGDHVGGSGCSMRVMVLYMGASVEDIKINGEVPSFEDSETESIAGDGAGH